MSDSGAGGYNIGVSSSLALGLDLQTNEETNFIFGNGNSVSATDKQEQAQTALASRDGNPTAGATIAPDSTATTPVGSAFSTLTGGNGGGGINMMEVLLIAVVGLLFVKFFDK